MYKQLGFIDSAGRGAMDFAQGIYGKVRGYAPSFVVNPSEKYIGPLVVQSQGICQKVLHFVDGKVDAGVHLSQDVYNTSVRFTRKVIGDEAVDQFSEAKGKYVASVSDSWQFFRTNGVTGTASALVSRRVDIAERAKVCAWSTAAAFQKGGLGVFERVRKWTPVQKTWGLARPYAAWSQGKYMGLHDTVVATPQYAGLYKLALGTFFFFASLKIVSWPANKTKDLVYPYIEWGFEPAIQQATPYITAAKDHLKPTPKAQKEAPEPLPASQPGQTANTSKGKTASTSSATKLE